MSVITTKQDLLLALRRERQEWNSLLAEVGESRMDSPRMLGEWSIKDTIAHLTTWWRREVARLASVQRGEFTQEPVPHPDQRDVQVINSWIYYTNRDRPIDAVLRDAGEAWEHLEVSLLAIPEEVLMQPGRFHWLKGEALGPTLLDDLARHLHEEHEPLIRAWLASSESQL